MKLTLFDAQTILSKHLGVEVKIETSSSYSDIPVEKQKEILIKSVREGSEDQRQALANPYLNLVTKLTLAPTGKDYIAEAKDVFKSYIDSDFKHLNLDKESEARPETKLAVYELVKDAKFKDIFTGDLDKICLTQSQIIEFCKNHKELLSDSWTLFLFKENDKFFVARVLFDDDGLGVNVNEFANDHVWSAGYRRRVVVATDL